MAKLKECAYVGTFIQHCFISRACQAKQIPKPKMEEEEEQHNPNPCPWEALDIDLDDEEENHSSSSSSSHSHSLLPILQRCSQTLTTKSQSQSQTSKLKSSSPPLIPGPAGELQSAMHHRRRTQEELVPTQEFIRRVVENPHRHDDHDFSTNPWLCALDFLSHQGYIFYLIDFESVNCLIAGF